MKPPVNRAQLISKQHVSRLRLSRLCRISNGGTLQWRLWSSVAILACDVLSSQPMKWTCSVYRRSQVPTKLCAASDCVSTPKKLPLFWRTWQCHIVSLFLGHAACYCSTCLNIWLASHNFIQLLLRTICTSSAFLLAGTRMENEKFEGEENLKTLSCSWRQTATRHPLFGNKTVTESVTQYKCVDLVHDCAAQ